MTWRDITVSQYQELIKIEFDQDSHEDKVLKYLSFFKDTPEDELENLQLHEYQELAKSIRFSSYAPFPTPKPSVDISGQTLYLRQDLNSMAIGEYIDLEYFFSDGFIKNLPTILAILYRFKENQDPLFHLDKFEPYGAYVILRSRLFLDICIDDVYGVIPKYLAFRDGFQKAFSSHLRPVENQPETKEDYSGLSYRERVEIEEEIAAEKSKEQFAWDLFLYELSKLNNCTFEEATKIPLLQAFGLKSLQRTFKIQI